MGAEAPFSVTVKSPKGDLYTLRGDNYDEFRLNLGKVLGADAATHFLVGYANAFGVPLGVAEASNVIQGAFPAAAAPPSTVGAAAGYAPAVVPQPTPTAAPALPPTVQYPGDCPHGVRVYVDKPARGKPWQRFECATPWSPQTKDSRCKPLNCA